MYEWGSPSRHVGFGEVAKEILMGRSEPWAPALPVSDQWQWPPILNRSQAFILRGKILMIIDPHALLQPVYPERPMAVDGYG